MNSVIKVHNLCKTFGGIEAVKDVSFEVETGQMLALIGPNGAGKSTCFNMLMGQLPATSGEVFLGEENLHGLTPRDIWRRGVGRTFQITATYPSMTVVENVQMALMSYHRRLFKVFCYAHKQYRPQAMELLALVGMENQADRHCAILAYGDLKRLELAIALSNAPKLLLMDEPTAGMAPKERIKLMQLTGEIVKQRQISVLFTEHDMDVVFAHAHKIMVLNRGQLIASGSVEQIRNDAKVQEVYLGGGSLYAIEEQTHA
jgi:branched-chain amino acid transport system ATP-binding protein